MLNSRFAVPFLVERLESRIQMSGGTPFTHSVASLSVAGSVGVAVTTGHFALFANEGLLINRPTIDSKVVDIYDMQTGQWSSTLLPHSRTIEGTAAANGGKAFFAGGLSSDPKTPGAILRSVDVYDTAKKSWSTTTAPYSIHSPSVGLALGNFVMFAGGRQYPIQSAALYNLKTRRWITTRMPSASINNPHGAVANGKAYVTTDAATALNVFDGITMRWSSISLPTGMKTTSFMTAVGTKLVTVALLTDSGQLVLAIYDTVAEQWSMKPLPSPFNAGTIVAVGTKVIFDGGPPSGYGLNIYDLASGTWSTDQLSSARSQALFVSVGAQAIIAGGNTDSSHSSAVVDVLTDTAPASIPTGSLSGNFGRHDRVIVSNTGDADLTGTYTIQLYASTDRTLNGAILVGSRVFSTPLASGASSPFSVRSIIPNVAPAGKYHLLAAVQDSAGNISSIAAEDAVFQVRRSNARATASTSRGNTRAELGAMTGLAHANNR